MGAPVDELPSFAELDAADLTLLNNFDEAGGLHLYPAADILLQPQEITHAVEDSEPFQAASLSYSSDEYGAGRLTLSDLLEILNTSVSYRIREALYDGSEDEELVYLDLEMVKAASYNLNLDQQDTNSDETTA